MNRLFLAAIVTLTGCSWVPNSTVRVAIPSGETAERWRGALQALRPAAVPFEIVTEDSFPPADLVWFEGRPEGEDFETLAQGAHGQLEALAQTRGLAGAWFHPESARVFPVAWNPWSWWQDRTHQIDAAGRSWIPELIPDNRSALAAHQDLLDGPSVGDGTQENGSRRSVADTWNLGSGLSLRDVLGRFTPSRDRLWAPWSAVRATPDLRPEASTVVVAQALGFWWNREGWSPQRVPEFLDLLWRTEIQAAGVEDTPWLPVSTLVPQSVQARQTQNRGLEADRIILLPLQTPANE